MGKMLSAAAIDQYRRDGYYWPVRVVSAAHAARYRERLESAERDLGGTLRGVYRIKPHLLSRGQELAVDVDEREAADIVLEPGEMSLHHVLIVHGSRPNASGDRRIGYAIRYIPTRVRQIAGPRDSATLVRGRDVFGHFDHEPAPVADLDPAALALHADISDRQATILYRGTSRTSF
jgi:hypothetical protein